MEKSGLYRVIQGYSGLFRVINKGYLSGCVCIKKSGLFRVIQSYSGLFKGLLYYHIGRS